MDPTRGATINGRPVRGGQEEAARYIEGIIKRQMETALSPEDKQLMIQANTKLMTHATIGMWLGSMAGAAFTFRHRFASFRRAASTAAANASEASTSAAARKFYPDSGSLANRAAGTGAQANAQNRFAVIARGLGFGLLGAFIGGQIGVASGTKAAQRIIKDSGHEQKIAAQLKQAMDQAMQEIRETSTGLEPAANPLLKRSAGFGALEGNENDSSNVGMIQDSNQNDAADERDTFLSNDADATRATPTRLSSRSDPEAPSRWEELRKSRAAPPSTWDNIRESSARNGVPSRSPDGISSNDGQSYNSELGVNGTSSAERDARRRKFEELMDKERQGNDSIGTDESFSEGKWK